MKKIALVLALIGLSFTSTFAVAGSEDCTAEQEWNEETQQCEPASDG